MTTPNEELILKLRGQAYTTCRPDQLCDQAADLLQSQAERIKELESEVEMWKATANAVVDFEKVQLRAEIAAIAATEPVAYRWVWKSKPWDIEGWCYTNTPPTLPELQEIEPLFTRPMPAQGVDARMIKLPEPDDTYCGVNYYTESQLKQAVRDAQDVTELVGALQLFAYALPLDKSTVKTCYAVNNQMRDAAHAALSKYKGAK